MLNWLSNYIPKGNSAPSIPVNDPIPQTPITDKIVNPITESLTTLINESVNYMDPIDDINLLDFDNHREGILIGRVKIEFPGLETNKKRDVLKQLIMYIKGGNELPKQVTILTDNFTQMAQKYQIKSLNFRQSGSIPDSFVIYVMG